MPTVRRLPTPAVSAALLALVVGLAPQPARSQTIFQNFLGSTFDANGNTANGSQAVPPDTMGAMGLNNQFAEFVNGAFSVYNAGTGQLALGADGITPVAESDQQFWADAGIADSAYGAGVSDPRLIFDPASDRWFASQVTVSDQNNAFLVAVSNTSDPTGGFTGYQFDVNPAGAKNGTLFADFDMLGLNGDGLYLGAQYFSATVDDSGNPTFNPTAESAILAISKSDLVAGADLVANHLFYKLDDAQVGDLPHPVIDQDGGSGREYFLSPSAGSLDGSAPGASDLSSLSGADPQHLTLTSSGGNVTVTGDTMPPNAHQKGDPAGGDGSIQTNDDRYSGAVIKKNGFLWAVQQTAVGGRAALSWQQIDPVTHAVVHEGLITDGTHDYYFGSIAVNNEGYVAIGYTRSGPDEYPSAYASVGQAGPGGIVFGAPLLLQAGLAPYVSDPDLEDAPPYRWGDYSNTVVDPSDPSHFWTIQEFSQADGTWATQITGISVPAPEPSAWVGLALGALGLAGLGWNARRRAAL